MATEFIDAEQLVRGFLRSKSPDPVELRVPEDRPERFTQIMRTGGTAVNRVLERVQLTIRGWGAHDLDAKERTMHARHEILNNTSEMKLVRGVEEVQGLQSNPDPKSGQARWEFTVSLLVRASR